MLSQFYVTAFTKSAQLRTHHSPLWSECIITPDCVYWCKSDILPEVSFLYPMSSIGAMHHYHRLQFLWQLHMTTGWSVSFLPWQYHANTQACTVFSGKYPFMCTVFMPRCLWSLKKTETWIYWKKRDYKTISRNSKDKGVKGPLKFKHGAVIIFEIFCPLSQLMIDKRMFTCTCIDKISDPSAKYSVLVPLIPVE